jgi:hypothetical protein
MPDKRFEDWQVLMGTQHFDKDGGVKGRPDLSSEYSQKKYINEILEKNKDKNFVKRILNPEEYGHMNLDGGWTATHKMTQFDNKVLPTVIEKNGNFMELEPREAYKYAMETGEYIEMPTVKEAIWMGEHYKKVWNE